VGSQAIDILSGNAVVERSHPNEFSGSRGCEQKRGAFLTSAIHAWTGRTFLKGSADSSRLPRAILLACVLMLSTLIARGTAWAQDRRVMGEQSTTPPQPPQAPASNNEKQDEKPTAAHSAEQKVKDLPAEAEKGTEKLGEETLAKAREWEISWLTGPYAGRQRPLVPLTNRQRQRIYLEQTFTMPSDYVKRMIVAGMDQWREAPLQWGDGWGAYGKRFASREGQFISANTLTFLGNTVLKYEPMYDQCECSGFLHRTRHAILRNFLTYNSTEQELRPQWALYAGAFAGGVISTTWRPSKYSVLTNGAFAMLGQAGYGSLLNFFIEFAGDINRRLGGRHVAVQLAGAK
jgi:hypothetical protein